VQFGFSKSVSYYPDVGLHLIQPLLRVTLSFIVYDNSGKVVASDASAMLIPQHVIDQTLREALQLTPEEILKLRDIIKEINPCR
jgi:hypothetical protein